MLMKKYIFAFFLIGPTLAISAQQYKVISNQADNLNRSVRSLPGNEFNGISGTPYFDENFYDVIVQGIGESKDKLRYNPYKDEMEFERDGVIYYLDKKDNTEIQFKDIRGTIYKYMNYSLEKISEKGYLREVYYSDKFNVYAKESMMLDNGQLKDNYGKGETKFSFKKGAQIYILQQGNQFSKMTLTANGLGKLFNHKKVTEFVKTNKLNLKDERQLARALDFVEKNQ